MNSEDLRVIKTRENIQNQFIECLKECSFQEITVKLLVERSRINRSTFYRHYEDKFDLLDQLLESLISDYKNSIDAYFVLLDYKHAHVYYPRLRKMIEYFWNYRETLVVLWSASLPINLYDYMSTLMSTQLFETLLAEYQLNEQKLARAQLYSDLFSASTLATIRWWLTTSPSLSPDELMKIMISNAEKGFFLSLENDLKN